MSPFERHQSTKYYVSSQTRANLHGDLLDIISVFGRPYKRFSKKHVKISVPVVLVSLGF